MPLKGEDNNGKFYFLILVCVLLYDVYGVCTMCTCIHAYVWNYACTSVCEMIRGRS